MTFLPIVQRELRAAARRRSTYRGRMAFALVTSLIAAGLILVENPAAAQGKGSTIFAVLTFLAFGYCLLAGIRHAADALSEEKREGTLGLLFLTDLKPYDVVAGKLASIGIQTFQGLFALFPVLATGLVLGGITLGEFWRMTAVLTNTLFVSLAGGLWISSRSRTAHRALTGTIALITVILLVPVLARPVLLPSLFGWTGGFLSYFSPATAATLAWDAAYHSHPAAFWSALLWGHLLGWSLLLFASAALPRSWQDQPAASSAAAEPAAVESAEVESRRQRRTRLLDINPILWLASRHERQRVLVGLFATTCAVAGVTMVLLNRWLGGYTFGIATMLNLALTLVLKVWVAWQASATLAEARRTGAVELILATPLKLEEIIRGHWQALQRFFLWPLVAALIVRTIPLLDMLLYEPSTQNRFFLVSTPTMTVFSLATLVLDLIALAWVGMWMGLSQAKPVQAFARTFCLVTIIPTVLFCLPNFLFDLVWIQWSRSKLEHEFRRAAADRFAPRLAAPHSSLRVPPQLAAPPVG